MMKIGEKIKQLRRERELTQEILAEFLGVTAQSVSKWERGESCPDIAMLPSIASFFKVTTDELLGVDDKENERKIKHYIDEYNDLRMKNTPYVFEQMSKAVKEFPGEYDLLVRYLEMIISEKTGCSVDGEKILDEVEAINNKILQYCTDDQIRIQAKRLVCMYYNTMEHITNDEKYIQKKMKIADEMPNMINSKEYLMTVINLPRDEHFSACRTALDCELLIMLGTVNNLINYKNEFSVGHKIKSIEKMLGILNAFYDDGNYGQCYRSVVFMLGDLGRLYFENGDNNNALKYLKQCAELAFKHDNLPEEYIHNSFLMNGAVYRKTKYGKTLCERMKERFLNGYSLSEDFKNCPEFKEILQILK